MHFVDDHPFQPAIELLPLFRVAEKAVVQHVRIRDQNRRGTLPQHGAVLAIRVSVVPPRIDRPSRHRIRQLRQLLPLVQRERLRGIQHERVRIRLAQRLEHRYLKRQRLAARGRRLEDNVPTRECLRHRICLVPIEPCHPPLRQRPPERFAQSFARIPRSVLRGDRPQDAPVDHISPSLAVAQGVESAQGIKQVIHEFQSPRYLRSISCRTPSDPG